MISDRERLCRKIGYHFKNKAYLKQALTHRSASLENNERLEFVGDSVLSFVITQALYELLPHRSEGELSQLRAFLVKGESLSEIAMEIQLGDYLALGQGELKSGGFRRLSILADALEALFAAVYFDGGLEAVREVILNLYQSRLNNPNLLNSLKDSKTLLQEYLQSKKLSLPQYILEKIEGNEHDQIFYVQCSVQGLELKTKGQASTRRKAEQLAAKDFLSLFKKG